MAYNTQAYNTPDFTGWWKCCNENCKREVNSKLWGTTCPECGRVKCSNCEEINGPSSPQPTPTPSPDQDQQFATHGNRRDHKSHVHHKQHRRGLESGYDNGYRTEGSRSRGPNYSGWWQCHRCGSLNNPHMSGWTCPTEGHTFCGYMDGRRIEDYCTYYL